MQAIRSKANSITDSDSLTKVKVYGLAEQSSYKARRKATGDDDQSTLDSLMDFVTNNSLGKIFLAGDFNARTKNLTVSGILSVNQHYAS